MSGVRLKVADRIESQFGSMPRYYRVLGWTPRGKVRLLREREGTELTCWWRTTTDLPERYSVLRSVEAMAA